MYWDHKQSIKEVARHVGLKLGAAELLRTYRRRRGLVTSHIEQETLADRFGAAYRDKAWVMGSGQESLSGAGSEAEAAAGVVAALPELLAGLGCTRLLDVGCGDWHWMRRIPLPCEYIGVDVVPEVVEANRLYEQPGVSFAVANAVTDALPGADVVLCREVLFHLSFADGLAALRNMASAGKWLLATTDSAIWFNSDIPTGDYRRVNLQRAPYRLPAPIRTIRDDAVAAGRVLALWKTEDLGATL